MTEIGRVPKSPRDIIIEGLLASRRATKANAQNDVKVVVLGHLVKNQISLPLIERPSSRGWIVAGGDGLDDKQHVLTRLHQRLKAAKKQKNLTWEQLFTICDVDGNGALEWKEFLFMVRGILEVPRQALCNSDLRVLFDRVDSAGGGDGNGRVDLAELLNYLARGEQDPELVALQAHKRILLVRRAIRIALLKAKQDLNSDARLLFKKMDQDGSNNLSEFELESFLRDELHVTHWDVLKSDLKEFYNYLNKSGNGVDIDEFLSYINSADVTQEGSMQQVSLRAATPMSGRKMTANAAAQRGSAQETRQVAAGAFAKPKSRGSPQQSMLARTWSASSEPNARWKARRKAHAMKSASSPNLSHTFTTFGRDRQPSNRLAVSYIESCQSVSNI
eukprot:TRINITY_DN22980_c0_g1_i1.p1 TRINITY_DN22980_c0_g1~~TRINITY_DN22980_c0_g1_i1.p1  ORF type:complete len:390 (-),score=52.29 TRINITY_DN22980_c0_g1_i1:93-1262(-)